MLILSIVVVAFVVIYLVAKYKIAAQKDPATRGPLESLLVSIMVGRKRDLQDMANAARTPEISREEGLQRCTEAINDLRKSFLKELEAILMTKSNLSGKILPELKKKPGYYNGKALESKKRYLEYLEKSKEPGAKNPQKLAEMAEKYKKQGLNFLGFRAKALARIDKATDYLQDIDFVIDETKMTYESRRMELDDLKSELEMMIGSISGAKFEQSMSLIRSLKEETADKLRAQNARVEAESWASGVDASVDTGQDNSEWSDDFDKL